MGYIYLITNKIDGKKYVGQTIGKDIYERWKGHLKKSSNCRYLKHALEKYGKDNFKIICICFDENCNNYEQEYMIKFNTLVPNGYNLRQAGNNGFHNEETKKKIGESIKSYYTNLPENEKKAIYDKQRGQKNHNFGKKMSEEQRQQMIKNIKTKKAVECYTLENKFIKTFESAHEAARINDYKSSANISHCCLGNAKTAYGFIWKFIN